VEEPRTKSNIEKSIL